MSSTSVDPRSFTKEKLKTELSNHNILLPPSDSKKEVYVDLYRQHVLTSSSEKLRREVGSRKARLEALSSDEDEAVEVTWLSKKKNMTNGDTDPITAGEVDGLTDDDLYMALARRGVTVGPIVDSTRRVYQKRLRKILSDETGANVEHNGLTQDEGQEDEFSDQDDEEPMETDVIQPEPVLKLDYSRQFRERDPTKTSPVKSYSRREDTMDYQPLAPYDDRPVITHRTAYIKSSKKITVDDGRTSREKEIVTHVDEVGEQTLMSINTHHQQHRQRKGISVWLQLFIIAVCALLVFLVLSNMEPAYENLNLEEVTEAQV